MESVTKHWSRWDDHDKSRAHAELIRLRIEVDRLLKDNARTLSELTGTDES